MKFNHLLLAMAMLFSAQAFAQNETRTILLDHEEDTANVTSLEDIIKTQEKVFSANYRKDVVTGVWKRKKHFSLSYAKTEMNGKKIEMYDGIKNPSYTADWAVNLKRSHTYSFHKRPIADIVSFGLEFGFIDLSANHFKGDSTYKYDSRVFGDVKVDDKTEKKFQFLPWGSEMYTFSYGMNLGPSITIAPFGRCKSAGLAHIRLQAYFTVGYRASLMWMNADNKRDLNEQHEKVSPTDEGYFETMDNSTKLSWGHGMTTIWGMRLNWKGIAVGFEKVTGSQKYQSVEDGIYGPRKYEFSETSTRFSLIYMW